MTGGRVVAVVGYSRRRRSELHPLCADRLRHAQRLAAGARAVILSGFAEAELMRTAWSAPDVPLVCDENARTTAGNAVNVAARARELGADELVVVTSGWHAARVRLLMRAALRGSGIALSVETANGRRPLLLLARELACLALLPVQLARIRVLRPAIHAGLWLGARDPEPRRHRWTEHC
jgi:uncharacterized SAM-binding protein YcdF (DUF218 family)